MTSSTLPDFIHCWWGVPNQVLCGEFPCDAAGSGAKIDALIDWGVQTTVNLTHPDDNLTPYIFAGEKPFVTYMFEIVDGGTVSIDKYHEIVGFIIAEMEMDRMVYLHCWGGIGRTATVLGCLLASTTELDPESIFAYIDAARKGTSKERNAAPETGEQRQAVVDYFNKYGKARHGARNLPG